MIVVNFAIRLRTEARETLKPISKTIRWYDIMGFRQRTWISVGPTKW